MREAIQTAAIWVLIFWSALTFLCLRGYHNARLEARGKPPLTDTEEAEIARIEAEIPRKEFKGIRWYVTRPKEGSLLLISALTSLPFVVLFLPMIVLVWILPHPYRR